MHSGNSIPTQKRFLECSAASANLSESDNAGSGLSTLNPQLSTRPLSEFLQQLLNGLSLGAIYALIALGYTMVYGVLRFINFAHSDVFMVGSFIGYYMGRLVPEGAIWGGLVVLLVSMIGGALLGMPSQ